ncbi:MAG: hypothetical protein Q8N18_18730 [Opitutaceae bacterium]|nr:hypothetical protein [Opitutaceae bacterium]
MSATIDHLRIDHRVTVLREFTDAAGITMRAGDDGILRELSFDQLRLEIHLGIAREGGKVALLFPLKAKDGPRLGHMREFFELGDLVPVPGTEPIRRDPAARTMIVPPQKREPAQGGGPAWWREAQALENAGRMEEAEQTIKQAVPHIGAAASIAEMYAERMRAFQRAGDEPRAIAAFKQAVDWMGTYAGWATSGGEGAALSQERDDFRAALAREFGYDPTEPSK